MEWRRRPGVADVWSDSKHCLFSTRVIFQHGMVEDDCALYLADTRGTKSTEGPSLYLSLLPWDRCVFALMHVSIWHTYKAQMGWQERESLTKISVFRRICSKVWSQRDGRDGRLDRPWVLPSHLELHLWKASQERNSHEHVLHGTRCNAVTIGHHIMRI